MSGDYETLEINQPKITYFQKRSENNTKWLDELINQIEDMKNLIIDLYDANNNRVLMASQTGKFVDFKATKLLKYNILNPLFGFKVMAAILFEALRIVFKGGRYYARKKKIIDTVSFEGSF